MVPDLLALGFGWCSVLILWWLARFTFLWCYNSFRFAVCVCGLVWGVSRTWCCFSDVVFGLLV